MMAELSNNRKETIVRILPIAVLVMIFTAYFVTNHGTKSSSLPTNLLKLPTEVTQSKYLIVVLNIYVLCMYYVCVICKETCATCPDGIVTGHCFDTSSAVLGMH